MHGWINRERRFQVFVGTVLLLFLGTPLLIHRASLEYTIHSIRSLRQCEPLLSTRSYGAGRIRTRGRCGPPLRRWIEPVVTLLEEPTLLSTPISTTLGAAAWLTDRRKGALTATVTAKPPSAVTPAGGTVSLMDGSTTRDTEARPAGTDRRRVREVISATGVIIIVKGDAIDDRSPESNNAAGPLGGLESPSPFGTIVNV